MPRLAGLREHHGQVVGPAVWEPIISVEDHRRLLAVVDQRSRLNRRAPRKYLLAAMVRCAKCEAVMLSRPRGDKKRRYVCVRGPGLAGCGKTSVVADDLEELVSAAVLARLESPELFAALAGHHDAGDADAESQIVAGEAHLEELAGAYGEQQITLREFLAARKPIEARIESARKVLARSQDSSALAAYAGRGPELRARWGELSFDRRRAVVAALLDHVTISAGRR